MCFGGERMLEVVFSSSVEGTIKCAQHCGKQIGGIVSVGIFCEDGEKKPSRKQQREAQRQAEQEMRRLREQAVPLGGTPQDVFCFPLGLSMGDISDDGFSQGRKESISRLTALFPSEQVYYLESIDKAAAAFSRLTERAEKGERIRIWYSDQPDEYCGMLWFLSELSHRISKLPPIELLKLPEMFQVGDVVQSSCGWGGVQPELFGSFLHLAQEVAPAFLRAATLEWRRLQEERMPLRVVVNGRVQSVPEDFYDSFLKRELDRMDEEFSEAALIGGILGRYQLGVGDLFLARRVEALIDAGRLIPVTTPKPGDLIYRRRLKKA